MESLNVYFYNTNNLIDTETLFSEALLVIPDLELSKNISHYLTGIVGNVYSSKTFKETINFIESSYIELIFIDVSIKDSSPIELITTIKHYRPGLPIIVLADQESYDEALLALREGAWDYVIKNNDPGLPERLLQSVQHVAEKKLQQMEDNELRSERNAFWAAAQTAYDGLAIIGQTGLVSFYNQAFGSFLKFLLKKENLPNNSELSILQLLKTSFHSTAQELAKALKNPMRGGDALWRSEISFNENGHNKTYELVLTSVSATQATSGFLMHLPSIKRHVLWVKDVSNIKEQERNQRELLSTTSHDLKGPISSIASAAELITESGFVNDSMCSELLMRIYSCARKTIERIDELLNAQKIIDGALCIKKTLIDISELISDLLLDYEMLARAKNHSITISLNPENFKINVDRIAFLRAFSNLLSNAIKYTPENGKIQIEATLEKLEARISISDNGPGIDAKARHRLFEYYGRLDAQKHIEGTGLGLYITKKIIEAHGGRIEVHSQIGVGSRFVIILPEQV